MPYTPTVLLSEPAYSLIETDMTPYRASLGGKRFKPDTWRGLHRYQIVGVNRDGRIALWMHDLGPAENFEFGPLQVLSLWEETVEWVQDKAAEIRVECAAEARRFIQGRQQELKERWPEMAYRQAELLRLNLANRSVFGPALKVERNAFVRKDKAQ
ncbi:hypothetical protein LCGC14_0821440 [marine sediment metagenome]|uniref:Uncharacterized protein n=1 Tax=marine sediment metagenome TaxID=412755 RepID=A0A0F9PNB7_9ZZZZ